MPQVLPGRGRLPAAGTLLYLLVAISACAKGPKLPAAGSVNADQYLYETGSKLLKEKKWLTSREYFRRLVDTYPGSPYRADAKLGIGDSYLGEGRADSHVLAANEFREFLQFFPLNPRADYAQYKLGLAQMKQMLGPQRDQTATKAALAEFDRFLQAYPKSEFRPEVDKLRRQVRDRLSESEFRVGVFHYRTRNYPGAVVRFNGILKDDPEFSYRDGVYFYLAESFMKIQATALGEMKDQLRKDALAQYEKILAEFKQSDYLKRAEKRIAELKR